jgi:hypothetical protein
MSTEEDFERIRDVADEFFKDKLKHGGVSLGLYILEGKEPVPIDDTLAWAKWFEQNANRRLAETRINGWRVSTVFLGIDNNLFSEPPLLFEPMIFSLTEKIKSPIREKEYPKSLDNYCRRYPTWDEALAGHLEAVAMIREGAQ